MFGMMDGIKMAVAAAVALAVAFYPIKWMGAREGRKAVYLEQAVEAVRIERERKVDDVETQNLDDYALCVRDIGARGLPVEACDELRRVQSE